jgi:hypothetical protein
MTEADLKAVADRAAKQTESLNKTAYPGCREMLARALENVDYFTQEKTVSLSGARHWIVQAKLELDHMHTALVRAETSTLEG